MTVWRRGWIALGSAVLALPVAAASPGMWPDYLGQWLSGLAMVAAAIVLFGWILRRLPGNIHADQAIAILAVRAIGARERIVLIQVGGEQLLLGVAPSGIHRLHRLQRPVTLPPAAAESKGATPFARLFARQFDVQRER